MPTVSLPKAVEGCELLTQAQLAYLRGDFAQCVALDGRLPKDDDGFLAVRTMAMVAAMSMDDRETMERIERELRGDSSAEGELTVSTGAVSMYAPTLVADWLRRGEIGRLKPAYRMQGCYVYAKYLQVVGENDRMTDVAWLGAQLSSAESYEGLYLRLLTLSGRAVQGRMAEARALLAELMALWLPQGCVTPFAEYVVMLGGLVEEALEAYPAQKSAVLSQAKRGWRNWTAMHNRFTHEHISDLLSTMQHRVGAMAAHGMSNAEIAARLGYSQSYIKKLLGEVFAITGVSKRGQLREFIL